ncbi:hypothetical protein PSTT_10657 [Puccinia striiformis]|uniref:Secreted protein n=1 Tax=Puccinia striiformis TaxID=27350 RepID=A0A2S4V3H7_9BASI|nr:hypothetical protein PSTT_10657 [Puccinia striiformis]
MTTYKFIFVVISFLAQISISHAAFQCYPQQANLADCKMAQGKIVYQQPSKTLGPTGRMETTSEVGGCLVSL